MKTEICVDGMANCGVGTVNTTDGAKFYTDIANVARQKGVAISVITMEGEDCSMENLGITNQLGNLLKSSVPGTAADITGGSVEIVDPLQLSTKVVSLLGKKTLATGLMCTMFLHKQLTFRSEDKDITNKLLKEIGNVTVKIFSHQNFFPPKFCF